MEEQYACYLVAVAWHDAKSSGRGFERTAYAVTIGLLDARSMQGHLTHLWSGRVVDKSPIQDVGARAAKLKRKWPC